MTRPCAAPDALAAASGVLQSTPFRCHSRAHQVISIDRMPQSHASTRRRSCASHVKSPRRGIRSASGSVCFQFSSAAHRHGFTSRGTCTNGAVLKSAAIGHLQQGTLAPYPFKLLGVRRLEARRHAACWNGSGVAVLQGHPGTDPTLCARSACSAGGSAPLPASRCQCIIRAHLSRSRSTVVCAAPPKDKARQSTAADRSSTAEVRAPVY